MARCRPKSKDDIVQAWHRTLRSRYYGLNLAAIDKHGTIELRLFEASEDPAYIDGSLTLAQQLVTEAKKRGKFVQWDRFARPGKRSNDPGAVLDALGFAASSCAGLARMRSKLLEDYALHPYTAAPPSPAQAWADSLQPSR